MGNNLVAQLESSFEEVCQQLVANDPTTTHSCTLQWSQPPFDKAIQWKRFVTCLTQNHTLRRLVLRDLDTLEDDYQSLTAAIQNHPTLTSLCFFGRLPTTPDFGAIFGPLFQNNNNNHTTALSQLEFQSCEKIPDNVVDGLEVILQSNNQNSTLDTFLLTDCRVEPTTLERLTKALCQPSKKTTNLKRLSLTVQRSKSSAQAVQHVATFVQHNHTLQDLELAGFLPESHCMATLWQVATATGHTSLQRLKLTGQAVKDASLSPNSSDRLPPDSSSGVLRVLDLASCDIHDPGAVYLAQTLTNNNRTLRELYLAYNSLGDDGIQTLSQVLGGRPVQRPDENKDDATMSTTTTCQLEVLDVRLNRIGTAGIQALCHALCSNTNLRTLYIGEEFVMPGRRFGPDDVQALVQMLHQNKTLQELYMEDASVGDADFATLLQAFATNTTLRRWQVSCFSTASLQNLAAALSTVHLETISVRVHGEVELGEKLSELILENLQKNTGMNSFEISGLREGNEAKWKALEPRIQAILSTRKKQDQKKLSPPHKRIADNGDDADDRERTSKRPRREEAD